MLKNAFWLSVFFVALIVSVCGSEEYYFKDRKNLPFQLLVREGKISLKAREAKLKEILLQISKKTYSFVIEGDDSRRVTDSFDNLSLREAIERLLSYNYGFITDEQRENIVFVFLASDNGDRSSFPADNYDIRMHIPCIDRSIACSVNELKKPNHIKDYSIEVADDLMVDDLLDVRQASDSRRDISFPDSILIGFADQEINDIKDKGENPKQFIISFGDYQMLYDLQGNETIASVIEREKPHLLVMMEKNRSIALGYPEPDKEKNLIMIDRGLNALLQGEISLSAIIVY